MEPICTGGGPAARRGVNVEALLRAYRERGTQIHKYVDAYRRYCWQVDGIDDLKLAPFHLMASEGRVHTDRDHRWHMDTLAKLAETGDSLLVATRYMVVDTERDDQQRDAVRWWHEMTEKGGEGMVVKPLRFTGEGNGKRVQPGVKCRGPEYLRIIYGPEYLEAGKLERLRSRGLSTKRQLAMREFDLGIEALQRFVRREPLRMVHECVLGVLAMESEPVDPRL